MKRRRFLHTLTASTGAFAAAGWGTAVHQYPLRAAGVPAQYLQRQPDFAGTLGVTTSSLGRVMAPLGKKPAGEGGSGQFAALDLPRILREELDLSIIDLNTSTLGNAGPGDLEAFRAAAEKVGCVITNLKLNQPDNMADPDAVKRKAAMAIYKRSIDDAALLGCRWVRALPKQERPDMTLLMSAYDEFIDYAAGKGLAVIIENYGWMQSSVDAPADLIRRLGRDRVAASVDIGNWDSNEIRYAGLRSFFPDAVTCDFKAKALADDGAHAAYDLEQCFQIGWDAGFRGPWCFEHSAADKEILFAHLGLLRDKLRSWMSAASTGAQA